MRKQHDPILFAAVPSLLCIALAAIVTLAIVVPIALKVANVLAVLS